jgi:hypothetical protein
MFSFYDRKLTTAQALKNNVYSSFLNDEASRSNVIDYHNELEEINW